jgi:hypothetical protein
MKRSFLMMMLAAATLTGAAGCPSSGGDDSSGVSQPFRESSWTVVIDQPFRVYADDGSVNIGSLQIGNEGGDNFRNRGDVIVQYADVDRITVEMRKFTQVDSEALAEADYDKLSIWGSTSALPAPPFNLDPEDNCVDPEFQAEWQDGCQIAVFYEGQTQVDRSGADLRVTLPKEFIFDLFVVTEDNDADSDYQNRGNVCIENLPGTADISLSNGSAYVILDETMPEMPECPDDLRIECENSGWNPDGCGCLAQGFSFSQVKITSNDGQAADGWIDIPGTGDFWVGYNLRNDGQNTPGDDAPGALCEAVVMDSAGAVRLSDNTDLSQAPNSNQGSINYPGEPATEGAGFSIQMISDQCSVILATEDPSGFGGVGNGPEQDSEERGNLTVCSGCIRSSGCDALIPGV